MSGTDKPLAPPNVAGFWRRKREAGEIVPPVYAVTHLEGSTQPDGYVQASHISLALAQFYQRKIIAEYGGLANTKIKILNPDDFEF